MISIAAAPTVIKLEGILSLNDANELKKDIMQSLTGVDQIILDLEKVDSINLPCIQLIFAMCWSVQKQGKSILLKDNWSQSAQFAFQITGFKKHISPFVQNV